MSVDVETGGPVDPIPYKFPDDGGGSGSGDPSIGLRPEFGPAERPATKTAVLDGWSRDKRVWANPDGTYTLEAGERLNYKATDGDWTAIDLTLVPTDGGFAPAAAPADVKLVTDAEDGTLAILSGDDGSISLRLPDPITGTRADDLLAFDLADGQPDVFVRATDTGFEFGASAADAASASHFDFILDTGTLQAAIDKDGYSIVLTDPNGKDSTLVVGVVSAPTVLDGNEHEADLQYVSVTLEAQPDGTYLLSYLVDAKWLAADDRAYPVTLDPTVCIRDGDTGCGSNTNAWDIWYGSGQASTYVTSSSTSYLHAGWYLGTGDPWGQARSILYFPGATLEDGAMVTSATLALRESNNYSGGTTAKVFARMIDKPSGWTVNTSSATWDSMIGAFDSAYDSPQVSPCNNGGTDCTLNLDVTKMVRAWYTRRGPDWQPNAGIQVRYFVEDTAHAYDETSFYRYTEALSDRPKLSITYEVPAFDLGFNSALGPTYAPSTMIAGQSTYLPIWIKNNSSYSWNTTDYRIGYRWYDTKGAVVGSSGLIPLTSSVAAGQTYTPTPAPSFTPPGLGQYTLRFDVLKIVGGVNLFASDWAKPTLYYSRNKNVLSSDATRWTGSSVIERDEFGITVVNGQGSGGDPKAVGTGDGGQLAISLGTKNLSYRGDSGLGIADRIPLALTYGYNSKDAAACPSYKGILGACGWSTNYDERVTAGSSTGDFTYYDPAGNAYYVDSDRSGQLIGAPVQLSRIRATLFDENRPTSGGTLVDLATETPAVSLTSGPNAVRVPANADAVLGGFTPNGAELSLNTYRQMSFALRNTDAASTAICFLIDNHTTGVADQWLCLIGGPYFNTGANTHAYSYTGSTVIDHWFANQNDIWELVHGNSSFGGPLDDYYIKTVKIKSSSSGNAGYTYIDDVAATQRKVWQLPILSEPAWTSGSGTSNSTEYMDDMSHQVNTSATCTGSCYSALAYAGAPLDSLQAAPIARWWWKKAGGTSVSMEFYFTDLRSGGPAASSIVYYAGALPTGADPTRSVQVSPNLPGHFTRVTRNILEDARQILGYYNDAPVGSTSTSPPTQGPTPDPVQWTGFKASAVDGQFMLIEQFELQSGPEWAAVNRYGDDDLGTGEYDFLAEFPDGSTHIFSRDGLLTRIIDRDQNRVELDWTYATSGSGQTAYKLTAIHAPGDATVNGGTTFNRQIDVALIPGGTFDQWTFTEALGSVGASIAGRRADFYVANGNGTTWADNDLVKVSPARHNSATCGSAPSGCTEFEYTSSTSHLLKRAADPRYDGTTDARLEIVWSGGTSGDPTEIRDRSHASAPLLRVLTFDRGRDATNSPNYVRPLYQDAAAIAAGYALHEDLTPEGSILIEYIRQACSGDCATPGNWPSQSVATLSARLAVSHTFDGLAHVSQTTTYRCPGVAVDGCSGAVPLLSVTRQGRNTGAKVDNYPDALAAAEVAWTQSADQYFASVADSAGTNEDLYRTEYAYNGVHEPTVVRAPAFNRVSDYPGAIKSSEGLTAYWRLGESSGTFADSSGNGKTGTGASVGYSQAGAVARDANTAVSFNGTSSKITSSTTTINATAYTIEAWVRSGQLGQVGRGIAGRYLVNSGARLFLNASGAFAMQHNGTIINSTLVPELNRWYHAVATWNGAIGTVYVDGTLVASGTATGNTTSGSSTFEIGTNSNGYSTAFFNGRLDEVALRSVTIDASLVRQHFLAGRGIAFNRTEATYGWALTSDVHLDAHPTQQATQLLENGDLENGLASWDANHGITQGTGASGKGIALPTTSTTSQVAQIMPGQRIHFQLAGRTDGTTNSKASYALSYWQLSSGTWVDLVSDFIANTTTWTTRAYEYTIPVDSSGLVRVALSDGGGVGEARFDKILVVTAWQSQTYRQHTNFAAAGATARYLQDGLPETTSSFGAAGAVRVDKAVYTATAAHPAIFPTSTIANNVDGTQGPGPDEDVTAATSYDSWGRSLSMTDPDGVQTETVYDPANKTDVVQVKDGLDNVTVMTYDVVGNGLTRTTPLGRATTSSFDARNHQVTATGPDGVKSQTDYDNYGQATASWANYVNGIVESSDGDLTDDLLTTYQYDAYGRAIQQDAECGSVAACATNGLDARTTTTYDLLGNTVATAVYPGAGGTGTARVTTNHFATTTSSPTLTRTSASGVQAPIAPTDTAVPFCPGSTTVRCNSAAAWKVNGSWVSAIDMSGGSFATSDGYGIATVADSDLAGRPVRVIAGFDPAAGSDSDTNVVTRTEYNLAGDVIASWDSANRRDERLYDPLGRVVEVSHLDSAGAQYLRETTEYLPSGRVDRTWDGASWTKTIYDGAGRAVQTLRHYDADTPNAHTRTDGFEDRTLAGWATTSGNFTGAGATLTADDDWAATAARTGRGRLRIATGASATNTGGYWDLGGPTFVAGHTYRLQADVLSWQAGNTLRAFLGVDAAGADYAEDTDADAAGTQTMNTNGTWQALSIEWTPTATTTGSVHFALRKDTAGTIHVYLDNVRFWDTTTGETDWNIPSATVYDADGQPIASVLPPGDPRTERELVSLTGFDPAGRATAVVANGSLASSHAINATGNLAYWPLDDVAGAAIDQRGTNDLTVSGPIGRGVAGGPDEPRGAYRFDGSSTYLSTATLPTTATDDVHLEAWFRYDSVPTTDQVIVYNGNANTGYGIKIKSNGLLAVLFSGVGGLDTTVSPSAGPWHYVRFERLAGVEKLYLDGVEQSLSNTTLVPITPSGTFSVGRYNNASGYQYFRGDIDEVAVWSKTTPITDHFATGRKTDAISNLTTRTNYDRLGRVTDAWAPDLVRTKALYDRLGNQTETITNYLDGTTTGGTAADDVRSTYAYDVLGELIGYCPAVQVKSSGSCAPATGSEPKAWHYGYDDMGRQTTTVPPVNTAAALLATEQVVYQPGGRIDKTCRYPAATACASTNSRHVDFTYDDLGRILTQKTYDRAGGSDTLKFTKTLTWNADGSPATVNEGSDTLTYVYDTAGRLSQFKRSSTVLTAYTYTAGTSTISTRTDGTVGATTFTYDWARRQTVIDPPDSYVGGTVTRTYRLDGLLATQSFPSSLTETLAYDEVKRPVSISLGSAGSISQAFDRAGRVTSDGRSLTGISGNAGSGTQSFTYDGLSRLTDSSGLAADTRAYQYDLDGNRTSRVENSVTTAFTFDRADQVATQLIGATTKTYDYDRYGNLLTSADNSSAVTTYAYDEASRLTTISPPGGAATQVTFSIDALDRHATRLLNGTTTDTYAYLDATETAWQTGQATPTTSLLDADGSRLAVKTGSTVSWLVFDLHGSVVALCTAGSSTLTDAYRFDGFGQQIAQLAPTANPFRYRGLLNIGADSLTGALLDMGARDYSPQLGAFTQEDSVAGGAANPMTMNRFLYALANPATLIDPDGHFASIGGDAGGAGYVAAKVTTAPADSYDDRETERGTRAMSPDCGFERLGCRSDGWARLAGFGMGLGQSAWDIPAGIWDLGAAGIDGAFCTIDFFGCNAERARPRPMPADAFASDPGAAIGRFFDGIGDQVDRITDARSGFEAAREFGHVSGTVATFVLPVVAAMRGARLAGAAGATADTIAEGSRIVPYVARVPVVADASLGRKILQLYTGTFKGPKVGSGTTMDAMRFERATGEMVGLTYHTEKGFGAALGLDKWLAKNPFGLATDRAIAQAHLDELMDLLR